MKRKHIDQQTLTQNTPPPSPTFAADTMARLRSMAAKEEEPIMKRKVFSTALIATLILALLAATAIAAMSLRRSSEADALYQARQALYADYGLTGQTLGLLFGDAEKTADGWIVTFTRADEGMGIYGERIGDYTVTLANGKAPETAWTFDDVDPAIWQSGSMDAPVWGQPQMEQVLLDQQAQREAYSRLNWQKATPEERAEVMPYQTAFDANGELITFLRIAPEETDLTQQEAEVIARQAILDTYGLGEEIYGDGEDGYALMLHDFLIPEGGGDRQHHLRYHYFQPGTLLGAMLEVWIASPSGEVLKCRWSGDEELRYLPDGPLDAYPKAVEEFLATGTYSQKSAMSVSPAAVKGDIVARVREAGMEDLLTDQPPYAMPTDGDISEPEALEAANKAMAEAYGFTDETLALFTPITSLLTDGDGRRWVVDYAPKKDTNSDFFAPEYMLGTYKITLTADTGTVLEAAWSLADAWDGVAYTQANWATAPAYHGTLLPWYVSLQEAARAIIDKYPKLLTIYDYTDEDAAAYDQLFRDAGFPAFLYYHALPRPEDLTKGEALALAKQAVIDEMGLTQEALDNASRLEEYSIGDSRAPYVWVFTFYLVEDGIEASYGVIVDAESGEILLTNSVSGGNG